MRHLHELRVLNHHRVNDTEESLVAREKGGTSGESVALHHALAGMLRQDLDDTSTFGTTSNIPLEVTSGAAEDGIQLVGHEFVGREYTEGGWIPGDKKQSAT